MDVPNVSKSEIFEAMVRFDREFRGKGSWANWPEAAGRHKYAILDKGRPYPIKKIISLATNSSVYDFNGGWGPTSANWYILERGFDVYDLGTMRLSKRADTYVPAQKMKRSGNFKIEINLGEINAESEAELANDGKEDLTVTEKKAYARHFRIERHPGIPQLVKQVLGTTCSSCRLDFEKIYGPSGEGYIEAHHNRPLASLPTGKVIELNIKKEFSVLCANCHRMIHRDGVAKDVSSLKALNGVTRLRSFLMRKK